MVRASPALVQFRTHAGGAGTVHEELLLSTLVTGRVGVALAVLGRLGDAAGGRGRG